MIHELQPGDLVAERYRLGPLLGEGGMGAVFAAEDLQTGTPLALKVIKAALLDDDEVVARFRRESALMTLCEAPELVHVIATGGPSPWFIAMELLPGEPLRALLKERRTLPLARAAAVAASVARGLHAAWERGLVHRDVKPGNIQVLPEAVARARDAAAVLLDFGIARSVDSGATVTGTGTFVGTPGYVAPEVALRGSTHDVRADLYSLGCVLYEMLVGVPVFSAPTAMALLMRHATEPAPSVRARVPWLPAAVDDVLGQLLHKDHDARFADAGVAASALAALAAQAPELPAAASPSPAPVGASPSPPPEGASPSQHSGTRLVAPATPSAPSAPWSAPPGAGSLRADLDASDATVSATALAPTMAPTPAATPLAAGATPPALAHLARGRVIIDNRWIRVERDDSLRLVRVTRTAEPTAHLDNPFEPFLDLWGHFPEDQREGWRVLYDMRLSPPNNDPAFEQRVAANVQKLWAGWQRVAMVTRTHAGRLQVKRMQSIVEKPSRPFLDEGEALTWLLSDAD